MQGLPNSPIGSLPSENRALTSLLGVDLMMQQPCRPADHSEPEHQGATYISQLRPTKEADLLWCDERTWEALVSWPIPGPFPSRARALGRAHAAQVQRPVLRLQNQS